MSRRQDDHLSSLRRRRDRLRERLAGGWSGSQQGLDATKRECAALSWAVGVLETAARIGDLDWLEEAAMLTDGDSRQREVGS